MAKARVESVEEQADVPEDYEDSDTVETQETDDEETAVTEGSTDDALADAEGRDRTDGNELLSRVDAERLVATNMGDEELRRAGRGVNALRDPRYDVEPEQPKRDKAEEARLERFAKLAKVKKSQIMAFNPTTGVGLTNFGGKYQMNRKGTQLRHLAGPVPDGVVSEREAKEQARLEKEANRED